MIPVSRRPAMSPLVTILLLVATHTAPATAQVTISGQVLDANGAGVDNVVVSLHFSDGTSSLPYTTPIGGTYQFANVNAPGQSMWIEYTKLGTGHKEIHDLSERTSQNLGVVLGLPPKAAGGIVRASRSGIVRSGEPNSPRTNSRPLRGPTSPRRDVGGPKAFATRRPDGAANASQHPEKGR